MPGALLQEVVGAWPLSPLLCVAWVFADVFLCTSSILSLTAICIGKQPHSLENHLRSCGFHLRNGVCLPTSEELILATHYQTEGRDYR